MEKDWYDKYGKEFHCADCTFLDSCLKKDEPLYSRCCEQYLRDRIAELEAQLKNAIVPKFNIGQEVWFISLTDNICNFVIEDLQFTLCGDGKSAMCYYDKNNIEQFEWDLFTTKEEAQTKLEELKGEKK